MPSKSQGQFPGGSCGRLVTARDTLTAWRAYRLRTRVLRAIIRSVDGVDRMHGAYEKGVRLRRRSVAMFTVPVGYP